MTFSSPNRLIILTLATAALLASGFGCGGRDIYKKKATFSNPPIERGYVYMSRDKVLDAGQEPVEFGSPVATKDVIFVASETRGVQAFERSNFRQKWQFFTKGGVSSELLLEDGVLYFGANDGKFYAIDAEFGKVRWEYETKSPVYARASVANKRVYFMASDDVVYCLDQNTGKWVWHYKRSATSATTVRGNSTPAIEGNSAYMGFSDGYLVSLNASDRNLIWEQKIHHGTKFTDVDAMPLIDGNRIYIPSYDGELFALDRAKGNVLWHVDIGGAKKVLMDDKTLYVGASNGNIYSVDKDTGRQGWKFELDTGTPTSLIQHGPYLAFGSSQQYFYVIHKGDGTLAYRFAVGLRSGFVAAPFQSGSEIFAFSDFGNLYVFQWKEARNTISGRR